MTAGRRPPRLNFGNGLIYNFLNEYYRVGGIRRPRAPPRSHLRAAGISDDGRGAAGAPHLQALPRSGVRRRRRFSQGRAGTSSPSPRRGRADSASTSSRFYRVPTRGEAFAMTRNPHRRGRLRLGDCPTFMAGKPMRRDKVIDQRRAHVVFEADEQREYISTVYVRQSRGAWAP